MKALLLLPLLALALGCSGGDDSYSDKAPPAKDGAVAEVPNPNKVRMGADGTSGMGNAPPPASGEKPLEKPSGM